MTETPRTWTLGCNPYLGIFAHGDEVQPKERVKVYEAAPVDVERERLLDLLAQIYADKGCFHVMPELSVLLREYGRLGDRRPGA